MDKKKIIEKILMAAGFIFGGIGMAATFGSIPDDIQTIKEHFKKDDAPENKEDE